MRENKITEDFKSQSEKLFFSAFGIAATVGNKNNTGSSQGTCDCSTMCRIDMKIARIFKLLYTQANPI